MPIFTKLNCAQVTLTRREPERTNLATVRFSDAEPDDPFPTIELILRNQDATAFTVGAGYLVSLTDSSTEREKAQ